MSSEHVAVVTGAASGIGFAIANALGEQDMKVAIIDINVEKLKEAEDKLRKKNVIVYCVNSDITCKSSVKKQ